MLYAEFADVPAVAGALRGMGAVAAGLVISTALKLVGTLRRTGWAWPCAAIALADLVGDRLAALAARLGRLGLGVARDGRRVARGPLPAA